MQSPGTKFSSLRLICGGELVAGWVGMAPLVCPAFGLLLGSFLVLVNRSLEPYMHTEILALMLIGLLILATGGRHLAGVRVAFDDLSGPNEPAETVPARQIAGLLAVLMVVLFKLRALEVIGESRGLSLLLTPLLARWSLVLFLFGSTSADDDAARRIAENVRPWHLIAVTVITLGFTVWIAGPKALWIALSLSLVALVARDYRHRRRGGISLPSCGAVIEVGEALGFTLFTSL